MNAFERIYQEDLREHDLKREKHLSIEMTDEAYVERHDFLRMNSSVHFSKPPLIPMNLEMPELEKSIREGKKNEKSESETPKKIPKKIHPKSNHSAVEKVQKKLR